MRRNYEVTDTASIPSRFDSVDAPAPEPAPPDIRPGDGIGGYTIRALIAAGGMGPVFSALDTELGREVALKLIRPTGSRHRRGCGRGSCARRRRWRACVTPTW